MNAGMIALQSLRGNLSRFFDTPHARRLRMTRGWPRNRLCNVITPVRGTWLRGHPAAKLRFKQTA